MRDMGSSIISILHEESFVTGFLGPASHSFVCDTHSFNHPFCHSDYSLVASFICSFIDSFIHAVPQPLLIC